MEDHYVAQSSKKFQRGKQVCIDVRRCTTIDYKESTLSQEEIWDAKFPPWEIQ